MPDFKDAKGDRWNVAVTGATIKRCLEGPLKVDLGAPLDGDPPLLTRFDQDIAFKVDLLCRVLLPQIEERGLTERQFADRLEGDALYHANQAFMEAWASFFHPLRVDLARAIQKEAELVQRLWEMSAEKVDGPVMNAEIEKAFANLDKSLDERLSQLGKLCASSPSSPDATPNPEPSES